MSISSVKTGAVGVSLLAGNTYYDPAATFLIARANGDGSSGTITFSSIPSTYQHLQLRWTARISLADTSDSFSTVRFNSDSGNNYAYHYLLGNGSSAIAGGSASQNRIAWPTILGNSATSNCFSVGIMDIHDYASTTKNKTVRVFEGWEANGSGKAYLNSGLWASTSAVTSLSIVAASSSNFLTNSTFALYGMVG